jgi:hypothetical protein
MLRQALNDDFDIMQLDQPLSLDVCYLIHAQPSGFSALQILAKEDPECRCAFFPMDLSLPLRHFGLIP